MPSIEELLAAANGDINAIDTDALTLDQIKELVLQAEQQQAETPEGEEPEQPRNEKGQFTKAEAEAETEPEAKQVFRREIDLGDGSGKEIFEAPSMEELLDKIVTAKTHATKKIREQQAQLKELQEQKKVTEREDADEEFVLSQDMLSRPTDAVKKAFKKATGLDITEVKSLAERVKTLTEAQTAQSELETQNAAASAFIAEHPEYVANQSNGARLSRAVNLLVAEAKHNNEKVDYATLLTRAYTDLSESGLLELKSQDANSNADAATTGAERGRIGRPEDVSPTQRPVRRASSLASRAHASTAPKATEPSEDDLYSMPLDKLRELANRSMR